ncbi:hypothetical protein [Geomonas sp.]|uniref:hypothetical protein n=1 Tax=Geomonas sp. TaxID=2651584 RepID=UPI002B45EC01|nr:hypothetical protein [Geomonas sp.]HJV34926.1 hypothetical protein [Geomonas sp.]
MIKTILPMSALALCLAASGALAADVSININGFIPPPPGVHVYMEGGRPCYREHGRVVYLERQDGPGRHGRGHAYGHYKGEHGKRGHRGHGEHRGHQEHGGHGKGH